MSIKHVKVDLKYHCIIKSLDEEEQEQRGKYKPLGPSNIDSD
jgi:hypothetical protein